MPEHKDAEPQLLPLKSACHATSQPFPSKDALQDASIERQSVSLNVASHHCNGSSLARSRFFMTFDSCPNPFDSCPNPFVSAAACPTAVNSNLPDPAPILVTGPARSGKSEWAENLALRSGRSVTYVATASIDPTDAEWQARIMAHQRRRPPNWKTLAVPIDLAPTIRAGTAADCLLIDSLGTWLANLLEQEDAKWQDTLQDLLLSLKQTQSLVILVAEETGWGVVPAYPIGRVFRDRLGTLTRRVGSLANPTYLVTGGHVLNLSQMGVPLDQALV
ncbi:MAG TPA: bifunctional adenosylcobinamide kinase/adenosylcobinamide-phosphate guanylyltransferase [Allocoleopsis sp.]